MKQETTLFNKERPVGMMVINFGLKGWTPMKITERSLSGSNV